LALPKFDTPFVVETDAFHEGIGAVLMQVGQPVAYLSKALGDRNKKLSIYEKEFLALIEAVDRWRPYLQRTEFTIKTDHKALSFLEGQELQSDLQRKAMTKLMVLHFKIQYKKGTDNTAADALSRRSHICTLTLVTGVIPQWIQEVLNSYATDSEAQNLLCELAISSPNEAGFMLDRGLIKKHDQVWIGNNSALRTKLIASFHDSPIGGHSGMVATYQRIKNYFYWRGLKQDVQTLSDSALLVNKQSLKESILQAFYNLYLYQREHGRTSLLILLKGFHVPRGLIPFWWWWIGSLSMPILFLSNIHSLQCLWLSC
jgi:hypothetical protein